MAKEERGMGRKLLVALGWVGFRVGESFLEVGLGGGGGVGVGEGGSGGGGFDGVEEAGEEALGEVDGGQDFEEAEKLFDARNALLEFGVLGGERGGGGVQEQINSSTILVGQFWHKTRFLQKQKAILSARRYGACKFFVFIPAQAGGHNDEITECAGWGRLSLVAILLLIERAICSLEARASGRQSAQLLRGAGT